MSTLGWQAVGMKLIQALQRYLKPSTQTIRRFGRAKLVRQPEGRLELIGGSAEDRANARDYISLIHHEAVVTFSR